MNLPAIAIAPLIGSISLFALVSCVSPQAEAIGHRERDSYPVNQMVISHVDPEEVSRRLHEKHIESPMNSGIHATAKSLALVGRATVLPFYVVASALGQTDPLAKVLDAPLP